MKNLYSIKSQLRYIIVIFLLNLFLSVNAQDVRRQTVSSDSKDIADELYKDGKYFEAISYYEKAKEENTKKKNFSINYNLAKCYRIARYYDEAEVLYAIVAKDAFDSYPLALFWQAMMEKSNENYKKASSTFALFSSKYSGKEKIYLEKARLEIEECAKDNIVKQNKKYKVEALTNSVNKEFSNNGVLIHGDTLWFSAIVSDIPYKEKISLEQGKGKYDEHFFLRIFTSHKESSDIWSEREIFDVKLDDKYLDIASPTVNQSGKDLFFTVRSSVEGKDIFKIYHLALDNDKKTKPEILPKPINEDENSSKDPFVIKIGRDQILFFTSDRKGNGGFDIFYSKMDDFGNFSEPKNLGSKINTRTNEHSPFYDSENETLYYSTKGKNGFGGYDIYKVEGNPIDGWGQVENYGYPVNSGADDYFYSHIKKSDGTYSAFISSNRKNDNVADNTCCDNIYQFDFTIEKEPELLVLRCSAFNKENKEKLENVNFKLVKSSTDKIVEEKSSNKDNNTEFSIFNDTAYYVVAYKEGYDTNMFTIINSVENDTIVIEDIFLKKLVEQKVIDEVIPEIVEQQKSDYKFPIIYYDFGDYDLKSSEKEKLDELSQYLSEENKDITIYAASHTDNIDTKNANIKLSKERTETVIAYLNKKGISTDRLIGQWYGEDKPIVENQTESGKDIPEARAKNRRTEFGIITDMALFQKGQMVAFAKELKLSQKAQNASGILDDATMTKVLSKYGDITKPELIFRVQVGAYRNADANLKAKMEVYSKLQDKVSAFIQREEDEGFTKFIIGKVSTLNEANEIKQVAKKIGIRSSFIAPYYKGERIRMVDAIEILAQ